MQANQIPQEIKHALASSFTVAQAAVVAKTSYNTIQLHCLKRSLPAIELSNGGFAILEADLHQWMGTRQMEAA